MSIDQQPNSWLVCPFFKESDIYDQVLAAIRSGEPHPEHESDEIEQEPDSVEKADTETEQKPSEVGQADEE